ncbi:MAG TPA: hypothetical protein VHE35_13315 [Kofleriaceae bacterium]|nr:hypothetical protein [Kofleriaceae bacterium]
MVRGWLHPLVAAALALGAVGGAGGCFSEQDAGAQAPDDGAFACAEDADCVLAGPSCCACPTFALPGDSGFAGACDGVTCPMTPPSACAPLVARCDHGACMAECAPRSCDLTCAGGFVVDATGCLACACASGDAPECTADTDCVRVPADCCGCDRGGSDTAIPVNRADQHAMDLMCSGDEACPGVSTCDSATEARCQLGRCVLSSATTEPEVPPPGACGRPELPPCPPDEVCIINDDDQAGPLGIGVCRPTPAN